MNLILACIDFSPSTDRVLDVAAELAGATKARLVIAHVVVRPVPAEWATLPEDLVCIREHERVHRAQLDQLRDRLDQQHGLNATTITLVEMEIAPALLALAERICPDLIIVGSHGYALLDRWFLGSASQAILHRCNWPVLVVPGPLVALAPAVDAPPHEVPAAVH